MIIMKKSLRNSLIAIIAFASSCMVQQEPTYNDGINTEDQESLAVENSLIQRDSVTVERLLHTDPTSILMSHVIIKDGVIVLDLSEEDALSLGISSELYSFFSSRICPPKE